MTDTNPLADLRLRETIDLVARVREIRGEDGLLDELDTRLERVEEQQANDEDPGEDPQQLRSVRKTLRGQAKACDRLIAAFCPVHEHAEGCRDAGFESADCTFVIQELMTKETAKLTDDVTEKSVDIDFNQQTASGAPKEGFHKTRTLELSVVDAPEGMPSRHEVELNRHVYLFGDVPDHVTDYLYQCCLSLNDAGEVENVGNLSDFGLPPAES